MEIALLYNTKYLKTFWGNKKPKFKKFFYRLSVIKMIYVLWVNRINDSSIIQIIVTKYSCLENPMGGGAWWAAVHGVTKSQTRLSNFTFTFHFHALEKEMATHSSVLAWRIPGTVEPGGLSSMGSHRFRHNWSDLAVAVCHIIFLIFLNYLDSLSPNNFWVTIMGETFIRCCVSFKDLFQFIIFRNFKSSHGNK